ncbi:MAG: hypothetical protein ACRELV_13330 [Longimicrobiales bacterium]
MRRDGFERWLRERAASYNVPPETPREEVWAEIDAFRAYHRPPETPRDAIWSGIAAARTAGTAGAAVLPLRARPSRWTRVRRNGWLVALAASLVLVGRVALERAAQAEAEAEARGEADTSLPIEHGSPGVPATVAGALDAEGADAEGADAEGTADDVEQAGDVGQFAAVESLPSQPIAVAPVAPPGSEPAESATDGGRPGYRLAAVHTLSRAEALMTSFRTGAADSTAAERNAEIALWAGDLLMITRLLMDSPATQDAQMAALLSDLELVLVQMIRLGGGSGGEEADLVREALRQRNLLPRLRNAVPAGGASIGA